MGRTAALIETAKAVRSKGSGPSEPVESGNSILRMGWTTCEGRFRRNLAMAERRWPELESLETRWREVRDGYELYRSTDGNYRICTVLPNGQRRWLTPPGDPRGEAESRPLAHDRRTLMPAPYLFDGLGFGWFFRRVYQATRNTFHCYSTPLFIVEPDEAAFALSLQLHDWRAMLEDPRVWAFVGQGAVKRFERTLLRDDNLPIPSVCVGGGFRPSAKLGDVLAAAQSVAKRRTRLHRRGLVRVESHYADRDARYWANRFTDALNGHGPPLRILSTTSRYTTFLQYSMRDLTAAFEKLGHACRVLIEPSDHHALGSGTCQRAILDFDPDLFFSIDHLRPSHRGHVPLHLPIFTWDQDMLPHIFTPANIAAMGPFDVAGGVSKSHCVTSLGCDEDRFCAAIMPTNPEVYSAEPLPDDELEAYRCDVSYVSNASQTPREFHLQERAALTDKRGRKLLDRMYELAEQRAANGEIVCGAMGASILPESERQTGVQVTDEAVRRRLLSWYLWRLGDRLFRHQALDWAAHWSERHGRRFHLYGRGWERHPRLSRFSRGVAANGLELRRIYQASTINLQLMPAGFLHPRALDGLSAGGFFLTRRCVADDADVSARRIRSRLEELGGASVDDKPLDDAVTDHECRTGTRFDLSGPLGMAALRCAAEQECAGSVLPRFDEIIFHDAASFEELAEQFINDSELRRTMVTAMRRVVLQRFTYEATMERFLRFIQHYFIRLSELSK